LLNYPLQPCLQRLKVHPDTVLGINKKFETAEPVQPDANLFDYMFYLLNQLIQSSWQRAQTVTPLEHELSVASRAAMSMDVLRLSTSETLRQTLIDEGVTAALENPMCSSQIGSDCPP
jgi:hypothetical protein